MPGPERAHAMKSFVSDDAAGSHAFDVMFDELKKKKKKEHKSRMAVDDAVLNTESPEPSPKKSKKKSKDKALLPEESVKSASKVKKSKKRKADDESPHSEHASKTPKIEHSESEDGSEVINPYAVSNFRISDALRKRLKSKGIEALFPIQALTFNAIFEGNDLVGRARTGQVPF